MVYPVLKLGFWIVVGVLALSFFGISLQAIVNSPAGQENFGYVWHLIQQLFLMAWDWVASFIPGNTTS